MIIVLCAETKRPWVFADALDLCSAASCPAEDCQSLAGKGTCVVGEKDGMLTCLGSFSSASVVMGCECREAPCEHMTEEHPALVPLIERFADLVEPEAERSMRKREEAHARLIAQLIDRPSIPLAMGATLESAWQRVVRYAPDAAAQLPLRPREQ